VRGYWLSQLRVWSKISTLIHFTLKYSPWLFFNRILKE